MLLLLGVVVVLRGEAATGLGGRCLRMGREEGNESTGEAAIYRGGGRGREREVDGSLLCGAARWPGLG